MSVEPNLGDGLVPSDPACLDPPLDLDTALLRRDRLLIQRTSAAEMFIGFGSRTQLLQRLSTAETLFKSGFDPSQPRDEDGRWTSGGAGDAQHIVSAFVGPPGKIEIGRSIFQRVTSATLKALEALARGLGRFSGPTAFLGAYFFPTQKDPIAYGTLPDHPDIKFYYNGDTGEFSLYQSDGTKFFSGVAGGDGLIRNQNHDVIGREVDGVVIVDRDVIANDSLDSTAPKARLGTDSEEPKLCPDPGPDQGGGRRQRAIDYQFYVSKFVNPDDPIPPGLAVKLWSSSAGKWVYFDDCYHRTGTMVDAKGPGYARILEENNEKMVAFLNFDFIDQAKRQLKAAGTRAIEWHCHEELTANHIRQLFSGSKELSIIKVIWNPDPMMEKNTGLSM